MKSIVDRQDDFLPNELIEACNLKGIYPLLKIFIVRLITF